MTHAPGPPGHGVVRHARLVAEQAATHGVHPHRGRGSTIPAVRETGVPGPPQLTHAQFTDAVWGPDIASAASAFETWAARAPRPLVVTLHDVPGADPDPARDARRGAGYARVVAVCDAVVVSAEHEAAKITRLTGRAAVVIDLPVPAPVPGGAVPTWADRPTLGVLGFVYPGKGHDVAIDVAAAFGLRMVTAGAAAPGHDGLVRGLRDRAAAGGVELVVTGSLSDADMTAAARAVTVPLVPSATVSASGTLMTWRGCGRRPLAAGGEYAVELARRHPGTVRTYDGDPHVEVARALADPDRTRLRRSAAPDAGAAHAALYRWLVPC